MTKKIFAALFMLCFSYGLYAEKNCMTIEMKDGEKYNFLLDSNPEITYSYGNLVVDGDEYTSYELQRVKNYYFTEVNSASSFSLPADEIGIVTVNDEIVEVYHANANEGVVLATACGVVIRETRADENGFATMVLPNQKGVYLLTIGEKTIKLIRK